jgi:hypothetical protein
VQRDTIAKLAITPAYGDASDMRRVPEKGLMEDGREELAGGALNESQPAQILILWNFYRPATATRVGWCVIQVAGLRELP